MRTIRAAIDAFTSALELAAVEARLGVSAVEAAALSDFEQQLRVITTSDEERQNLREIALMAGKMGLESPEALHAAVTDSLTARGRLMRMRSQIDSYLGKDSGAHD